MPRRKKAHPDGHAVASLSYPATRKNIPPAGLESHSTVQDAPRFTHHYNPHLPPVLRSAPDAAAADALPELLAVARQRPLTGAEAKVLARALKRHEPWLEWSGKRERPWFEVEPVALHMHERVSTQAILRALARQDVQRELFADPQHDYAQAVQFYRHNVDWANRMILGDSLQVMASLARREDLAGKVQMIYLDPPYGIRFASNFQPQLGQRDVKDRQQDLTREPEMVKAYRDTWTLGIHSYLAYLRDRLAMARELLTDTGSIFVQIGDENVHRVRCVMDEIFGPENFVSVIVVAKTSGFGDTTTLASVGDFLLWYAKQRSQIKYLPLYWIKDDSSSFAKDYKGIENAESGWRRNLTREELGSPGSIPDGWKRFSLTATASQGATATGRYEIAFQDKIFQLDGNQHWKTSSDGFQRLIGVNRIHARENSLRYIRYMEDFPLVPMTNNWSDLRGGGSMQAKKDMLSKQILESLNAVC